MFDYINGKIAELSPASATIDCGGVGFQLNITLNTFESIKNDKTVKLFVYEVVRDDAFTLYGFISKHERELFKQLISVSGVGPATARIILSTLTTGELQEAIISENATILQTVKGIGSKTAHRLIIDLKDKIKIDSDFESPTPAMDSFSDTGHAAISALIMLGFSKPASGKAVTKILRKDPALPVEIVIKEALKCL